MYTDQPWAVSSTSSRCNVRGNDSCVPWQSVQHHAAWCVCVTKYTNMCHELACAVRVSPTEHWIMKLCVPCECAEHPAVWCVCVTQYILESQTCACLDSACRACSHDLFVFWIAYMSQAPVCAVRECQVSCHSMCLSIYSKKLYMCLCVFVCTDHTHECVIPRIYMSHIKRTHACIMSHTFMSNVTYTEAIVAGGVGRKTYSIILNIYMRYVTHT